MNAQGRSLLVVSSAAALIVAFAAGAHAAATVVDTNGFSLQLGLRIQPRMELDRVAAVGGGREWQRDFLVRRARIKATGRMLAARYNLEWKMDRTDQIGQVVNASAENAYVQCPLGGGVELRAGLYDQPFSRDRLTSDSKQLAVDRGAVSNVPDGVGLADNVIGFEFLGKLRGGRAEVAAGAFDNRTIAGAWQDFPMLVGRLDLNFGSTKDVFMDAHFGRDSWYSLGVDGSYQGSLEDGTGADDGSNAAVGVDGMIDVPVGRGRLFMRSEVNGVTIAPPGGNAVTTTVWMIGAGYLLFDRLQPIVRFDEVRLDDAVGGGTRDIIHLGANFYRSGHGLKFQGDVRLESGTGAAVDGVRLQTQVDF